MINVDNKIKNIYYMLCYSFYGELLNIHDEASLGSEAFDNIYNLFSLLLFLILKKEIKKGLYKEYIYINDEVKKIKGRIKVNQSINNNSLLKKKIFCEYDEYNENCLLNQIIKTTIFSLIKSNKIGIQSKDKLKKIFNYFVNVDFIKINSINWNGVRFNRNNLSYKFVLDLCKLILNGLIVSDEKGNNNFKEFLDDKKVSFIYENFIKAYYRKHYPELNAISKKLYLTKENSPLIPIMKTDITLEYNNKILIIDAKFYNKILKENYIGNGCKTISSNNIYQIISYVDNIDPYKENKAFGMLLYAQTIDEKSISLVEELNMHKIFIKTLDMNAEWNEICKSLNGIADNFKACTFTN